MIQYWHLIIPSIIYLIVILINQVYKLKRIEKFKDLEDSKIKAIGEYEKKSNLLDRSENIRMFEFLKTFNKRNHES